MYNKKVMEHFTNPKNVGEIKDASTSSESGNPICGDMMRLYVKVEDNKIIDIKFKTFGCGAAIASSSVLTEIAKGKTLEEAFEITKNEVSNALGGLPENKMHCSVLGVDALRKAICNYWREHNMLDNHPECKKIYDIE